jgi:uncharacterized protein with ParB-like and HNH nuclease domain
VEASPAKVIQYFNGEKQNLIPLFQRAYTWDETQWSTFWQDLLVQYEEGEGGIHFMGAIVSLPARSVPVGVSKFSIIDGQQRLTTVSVLLCALRDLLNTNSAARIQEVYLTNKFREVEDTLKFVPTQADREAYQAIIDHKTQQFQHTSRVHQAYEFFKRKISNDKDTNDQVLDPERILTTLERSLQVVMINLSEDDDPYLIFESLNFKGEPLTQADLVRNYLLMRFKHSSGAGGIQEKIFREFWKPLEEKLSSQLTEFLRHYVMKDGDDIKQGGIYVAFRRKLKEMEAANAELEIRSIGRFGNFYSTFLNPNQETDVAIASRLENLRGIKMTTAYPLLLRLFDARFSGILDVSELAKCLRLIESFVVRRAICGIPSNSLSKIFLLLVKDFPKSSFEDWLGKSLYAFVGNQRFPRDEEFKTAFKTQAQYGRGTTKFVLSQLEKSFFHKETVDLSVTTIEHVLPQTLTSAWKLELGESSENEHELLVGTMGNLTLTGYNSEASNSSFEEKQAVLSTTHIELNRWILDQQKWGRVEIELRATMLFDRAKEIWPLPN